jgi:hypothetical protein
MNGNLDQNNGKFVVTYGFYKTPDQQDEAAFYIVSVVEGGSEEAELEGHPIKMEVDKLALCNGLSCFPDITFDAEGKVVQPRVEVAPGIYCQVAVQEPGLPRRVHPQNKKCSECLLYSREKGIEVLHTVHKKFQDDQELKLYKEVIDQVSTNYGVPMLTKDNVGYCPKTSALVADTTPACVDGFKEKP